MHDWYKQQMLCKEQKDIKYPIIVRDVFEVRTENFVTFNVVEMRHRI